MFCCHGVIIGHSMEDLKQLIRKFMTPKQKRRLKKKQRKFARKWALKNTPQKT